MTRSDTPGPPDLGDERRGRLTELLYRPQPRKSAAVPLLMRAAEVGEAERAALVWTEEHDPQGVYTSLVVDRYARRPRGRFTPEHLLELEEVPRGQRGPRRGALWVTLEGPREWFLALDAGFRPLRADRRGVRALSSIAGSLRELLAREAAADPSFSAPEDRREASFRGWTILADHDADEPQRVRARFELARLLERLRERAFVGAPGELRDAVGSLRNQVSRLPAGDREREALLRVVEAVSSLELEPLVAHLPRLSSLLEDKGRLRAAEEFHRLAYWAAVEFRAYRRAVTAARWTARTLRKRAQWQAASAWYELAHDLAQGLGDPAGMSLALQGKASIHRDRGSLPKARRTLERVIRLAETSGSRQAIAHAHHEAMAVAHVSGDNVEAARHGWEAVRYYDDQDDLVRALADLAEACRAAGDLVAAESGFRVVVAWAGDTEALAHALGTLAEIAALRRDRESLERWLSHFRRFRRDIPVRAVVRFLFDLGQAYAELAEVKRATEAFTEVEELAEAHGFAQLGFEARAEMERLASGDEGRTRTLPEPPSELREVREGLARLEASSG